MGERERLDLDPGIAAVPEVGRWLAALQDARTDRRRDLEEVTPAIVDGRPAGSENSIGAIFDHVSLIEADWLFDDLLGQRLDTTELAPLSLEAFTRMHVRERYDVSGEWVVHHLLQHESEHRSELGWLGRRA